MKKLTLFIPLVIIGIIVFSCQKSDTPTYEVRDFQAQYLADLDSLDAYFDDHYMTVDANYNVTIAEIPTGGTQQSIRQQYNIIDTIVKREDVDYHLYFIKFREGTQKRPTQVDSVFVSYKGVGLDGTKFDEAQNPVWFKLQDLIPGWIHILPDFKTGTYTTPAAAEPSVFDGYGAGVMFLPSGFGYFNQNAGVLSAYSPLVFNFKLYDLKYRDHDGDGILSKDERKLPTSLPTSIRWKEHPYFGFDFDGDGVTEKYDTDGDNVPNMFDTDDDNDNYSTKYEIKNSSGIRYSFDGIPDCSGDITTPTRLKRHLDPNCH